MSPRVPRGHISSGEARILAEYTRGGDQADVARRLHLEPVTVRRALTKAKWRVGADNNVQLLAIAVAVGDVVLPTPAVTAC